MVTRAKVLPILPRGSKSPRGGEDEDEDEGDEESEEEEWRGRGRQEGLGGKEER